MSLEITLDDLEKAAGNLGRLHEYLAARSAWAGAPGAGAALERIGRALARVTENLAPLLVAAQVGPGESAAPGVEPKPPGTLDPARLERFAGFLEQLSAWFDSRGGCPHPHGGHAALASIAAAVDGAQRAVAEMLRTSPARTPAVPPPIPPAQSEPSAAPSAEGSESPAEDIELPPNGGQPLVLDPAGDVPLFQTRAGFTELSSEAQGLLDDFVTDNGLVMNPGQRRAFGVTVKQRLEGAPEGHALLIRVGGLRGRLEPYFAYTLTSEPEDEESDGY